MKRGDTFINKKAHKLLVTLQPMRLYYENHFQKGIIAALCKITVITAHHPFVKIDVLYIFNIPWVIVLVNAKTLTSLR